MFSFAVTAFCEMSRRRGHGELIKRCLAAPSSHPGVDSITVIDDHSDDFDGLEKIMEQFPKVTLYRNDRNLKVFGNKIEAILRSKGDWVITCDSDNCMDMEYIDLAIRLAWDPMTWLCPTFAKPHFDYRSLAGDYDRFGIRQIANRPDFTCFVNTGNQVVNRHAFAVVFRKYRGKAPGEFMPAIPELGPDLPAGVWDGNDSRLSNLLWLKAGGRLWAVSGLEYEHHVSDQPGNYVICARDPRCAKLGAILDRQFTEGICPG